MAEFSSMERLEVGFIRGDSRQRLHPWKLMAEFLSIERLEVGFIRGDPKAGLHP